VIAGFDNWRFMAPISTRNLSPLPDVNTLRRLLQSLAMLDAIIHPDWAGRYYSFNAHWARGEQMGSMHTGSGDNFFALFNKHGCWLKGFAHESVMSPYRAGKGQPPAVWPGVLDSVPEQFAACLKEPAFTVEDTTFCIWRRNSDAKWQCGQIMYPDAYYSDGSHDLLALLDGQPQSYKAWADEYYENEDGPLDLPIESIHAIYQHRALTDDLVKSLNPTSSTKTVAPDAKEIGFPDHQQVVNAL
jgi:hypothetical protein